MQTWGEHASSTQTGAILSCTKSLKLNKWIAYYNTSFWTADNMLVVILTKMLLAKFSKWSGTTVETPLGEPEIAPSSEFRFTSYCESCFSLLFTKINLTGFRDIRQRYSGHVSGLLWGWPTLIKRFNLEDCHTSCTWAICPTHQGL